jgi:hypothetical protein
MMRSEV